MDLKRGIDKAVKAVVAYIKENAEIVDDNYDKIYLNVEKYDFLSCESVGVYVDKDKNEYAINIYQSGAATRAYHILTDRDRMTLSRPEFDGDCLKVKIEGVNRSLKPMAKWPYKTYDQLQ